MKRWMKNLLGTLAFWAVLYLGAGLFSAACWMSYSVVGCEDLYPRDFVYLGSQGFACYLAYLAVVRITGEPDGYCVRYNCLAATVGLGMIALTNIASPQRQWNTVVAVGIGCVVSGMCLSNVIKAYGDKAKDERQEPEEQAEKPKTEKPNIWMWAFLATALAAACACIYLFNSYIPAQVEAARNEEQSGWNEAYETGYNDGKIYQWDWDCAHLTVRGMDLNRICKNIDMRYGMTPAEAYDIVEAYGTKADHGGYSWEEYQNALDAVLYTVAMIPDVGD